MLEFLLKFLKVTLWPYLSYCLLLFPFLFSGAIYFRSKLKKKSVKIFVGIFYVFAHHVLILLRDLYYFIFRKASFLCKEFLWSSFLLLFIVSTQCLVKLIVSIHLIADSIYFVWHLNQKVSKMLNSLKELLASEN